MCPVFGDLIHAMPLAAAIQDLHVKQLHDTRGYYILHASTSEVP